MIHNPELINKLAEALEAIDLKNLYTAFMNVKEVKEALEERVRKTQQGRR